MPEAPRDRPAHATVLRSFSGHLRARPRDVFEAIDRRMRPGPESDVLYSANPSSFFIISQGGWWYRGEYRVVPDERGSHLEHFIVNVATRGHSSGPWTARKILRESPAAFERLLRELRSELE